MKLSELLALGLCSVPVAAAALDVKDPIGDAGFPPTGGSPPDLRSASVTAVPGGGLRLQARFARGTFDRSTTFVQFSLLEGSLGSDGCAQCGNYLVDFNGIGGKPGQADVRRLTGDSDYPVAGTVPVRVLADGIEVVVPKSLLPLPLAKVSFRVVTCVKLDNDATSIILDALPDSGMASAIEAAH